MQAGVHDESDVISRFYNAEGVLIDEVVKRDYQGSEVMRMYEAISKKLGRAQIFGLNPDSES
jgi:hypothetical protein